MKQFDFMRDPDKEGADSVFVGNRPKRRLNLFPLVVCFFIAIAIWIYMVNINDNDVTATVTIPIKIEGADDLQKDKNLMVYGFDKDTVTVSIKGTNRDLKKYTDSDYAAYVDVSGVSESGRHTLPVYIITPEGSSITVAGNEQININLYSDEMLVKSVDFEAIWGDIVTVSTYNYSLELSHNSVEVSGPRSLVEIISKAQYKVDGELFSSKSFSGFDIKFYDANGNAVDFEKNIMSYSTNDMTVVAKVTHHKEVPLQVKVLGKGSDLSAFTSVEKVNVIGDPMVLAGVADYTVILAEAVEGSLTIPFTNDWLPVGAELQETGSFEVEFIYQEEIADKNIAFEFEVGEFITMSHYEYDITCQQKKMSISGPKSLVERIVKAVYVVEGEFYNSKSLTGFTDVIFYDAEDNEVKDPKGDIRYSTSNIKVNVSVSTKKSVPVDVRVMGTGSDLNVSVDTATVLIQGDPMILQEIDTYDVIFEDVVVGPVVVSYTNKWLPDGVNVLNEGQFVVTFSYPKSSLE